MQHQGLFFAGGSKKKKKKNTNKQKTNKQKKKKKKLKQNKKDPQNPIPHTLSNFWTRGPELPPPQLKFVPEIYIKKKKKKKRYKFCINFDNIFLKLKKIIPESSITKNVKRGHFWVQWNYCYYYYYHYYYYYYY